MTEIKQEAYVTAQSLTKFKFNFQVEVNIDFVKDVNFEIVGSNLTQKTY